MLNFCLSLGTDRRDASCVVGDGGGGDGGGREGGLLLLPGIANFRIINCKCKKYNFDTWAAGLFY